MPREAHYIQAQTGLQLLHFQETFTEYFGVRDDEFSTMWTPNEGVKVTDIKIVGQNHRRATASLCLLADDPDSKGVIMSTSWKGTVRLVKESGSWRYDGGDFTPERPSTR